MPGADREGQKEPPAPWGIISIKAQVGVRFRVDIGFGLGLGFELGLGKATEECRPGASSSARRRYMGARHKASARDLMSAAHRELHALSYRPQPVYVSP